MIQFIASSIYYINNFEVCLYILLLSWIIRYYLISFRYRITTNYPLTVMNLRIRGTIFRMSGFDLLSIRNLMDTMGAVEQAMEGLKIPEEEKRKYLDELKKHRSTKYINFENSKVSSALSVHFIVWGKRPILFTVEKEGLSSRKHPVF